MKYNLFKSRTFWTIVAMFMVGGLSSIEKFFPMPVQTLIEGVLGFAAIYFHLNPSQEYNK